jgi:sialic acid synthase SpsE
VIAEIGVNHDGSVERAVGLIHAAAAAGADAVKFQWFQAGALVAKGTSRAAYQGGAGADQASLLQPLELTYDEFDSVVRTSQEVGIHAIVTPFSESLVGDAATLAWDAWKVASPDLVHQPLLERIAGDGRPMILSSGAASLEEVVRACSWVSHRAHAVLQCVSAYPTEEACASLGGIAAIEGTTGGIVGYSDHTKEVSTGGLAVVAGAAILEKHLTWNTEATGPDHAVSLEPEEFKEYVLFAHRAHAALGGGKTKEPLSCEADVRNVARQSIHTRRAIEAGEILTEANTCIKRPASGLEPWELVEVIGRRVARDLEADAAVQQGDIE